jgi:hypothetical protein
MIKTNRSVGGRITNFKDNPGILRELLCIIKCYEEMMEQPRSLKDTMEMEKSHMEK